MAFGWASLGKSNTRPSFNDRSSSSGRGDGGGILEDMGDACKLSYKQRLTGFISCLLLGILISFLSFFSLYTMNFTAFAILYTLGNLLALGSTAFLMGPVSQMKRMFDPTRLIATCVYLGSMVATFIVAFKPLFMNDDEENTIVVNPIKDIRNKILVLRKNIKSTTDKIKKKSIKAELEELEKTLESTIKQKEPVFLNNQSQQPQQQQEQPSRAQRKKELKNAKYENARKLAYDQSYQENTESLNENECSHLQKLLDRDSLIIHQIPADGHCLFASLADQFKIRRGLEYSVWDLRKLAIDFMRKHQDDFIPYLYHENGERQGECFKTQDEFNDYCDKIERTAAWGGHLEIQAIAVATKVSVKVYHALSEDPLLIDETIFNTENNTNLLSCHNQQHLTISYHQFAFGLGSHYNSLHPSLNPA